MRWLELLLVSSQVWTGAGATRGVVGNPGAGGSGELGTTDQQKPIVANGDENHAGSGSGSGGAGKEGANRDQHKNPFTKEFKAFAADTHDDWHLPGMAVAVIDGNSTFFEGFGLADISSQTAVTKDTLFMTGSTTKAFTDAMLGLLIASGNHTFPPASSSSSSQAVPLSWRTPISTILGSDFVMTDEWATKQVTLEDAATHRTGLSRHDKASARFYPTGQVYPSPGERQRGGRGELHRATPRDVVRALRYLPLSQELRTTFQYCNLMYVVLSHCIESMTSRRLGDLLREYLWDPLGMRSTFFGIEDLAARADEETLGRFAKGYYWDKQTRSHGEMPPVPQPEIAGAGLVISSVSDYAAWIRCQLDEGFPLDKDTHRELRRPKIIAGDGGPFDGPTGYASGWDVAVYRGRRVYTHGGMMEAFGAMIVFFPDEQYGVVSMGNTAVEGNAVGEILVWRLIDDWLGVPETKRFGWGEKWEKVQRFIEDRIEHAVDTLFPDRKGDDPLPPALPWEQYAGRYYHPAYLNMTLELGNTTGTLRADRTNFTWQTLAEFQHVSGEYWVMYSNLASAPGSRVLVDIGAVEFKIGVNGKVSSVGVEWRDTLSEVVDGWIWYDRVD